MRWTHWADLSISCKKIHQYIGFLGLVLQFLVASEPSQYTLLNFRLIILVPCATRVYALYNKNRNIFTGLIVLMIMSITIGIVSILR